MSKLTIDLKDLKKKFDEYCEKNSINKSKLVRRLLREFLEKKGVKFEK